MVTKSTCIVALKVVVSVAAMVWLISQFEFSAFTSNLEHVDYWSLLAGVLCFVTSLTGVQSARLYLLLKPHDFSLSASKDLVLLGVFFNNLLPTGFGGDAVKGLYIRKRRAVSWQQILATLGIERLSGLLVLVLAGLSYVAYLGGTHMDLLGQQSEELALGGMRWPKEMLALLVIIACLPLSRRVRKYYHSVWAWITGVYRALTAYDVSTYVGVLALSGLFHGLRALAFYFFVRALNEEVSVGAMLIVLLLEAIVSLLPVTIGALGVREGAISYGVSLFEVSLSTGIAVALFSRLLLLVIAAWGCLTFFRLGRVDNQS